MPFRMPGRFPEEARCGEQLSRQESKWAPLATATKLHWILNLRTKYTEVQRLFDETD